MKKKRIIAILLAILLLGCLGCAPVPGESWGPAFFLNGKKQNVYTSHYSIGETDAHIPFNAFLESVGADTVESPYNRYQVECYEIQGIRYIYDWESEVVALEQSYDNVVQTLKAQGKMPTKADFKAINLLPEETKMSAEVWLTLEDLESVFEKMGLDVTVEIDREGNAIRVTMPDPTIEAAATETPAGNPYYTCTGTEYGPYPILAPEQREAETKMFFAEYRELLERAAAELLNRPDIGILSGEACMQNDAGMYEPIDASILSDNLRALMQLSEEEDVDFYVCNPYPVFAEDAAPYFKAYMPMAIDTTIYQDPGTLYYVALIYTMNTEEQLTDFYRNGVKPLDGNWFIETYFYVY